jgi:hypothetical protein
LKVIVEMDSPQIGLADRVRQICSQALLIEPRYPDAALEPTEITNIDPNNFDPAAEFCNYYQNRLGTTPKPAVLEEFQNLYKKFKETVNIKCVKRYNNFQAPSGNIQRLCLALK